MCKENNAAWSMELKIWSTYVSSFLEGGVDYIISFLPLHFKNIF